ncbi:hypothetical protein F4802DRAFT_556446 [Xylaria palmicola]|nr:hypothetical protein F4802DRAFT_556446 [Xylaria palmicola]
MATHQQAAPRKLDLPVLRGAEIEHAKPGPQSPRLERDAARAVSHTAGWQPSLGGGGGGRPMGGYREQDRRRELMMGAVDLERQGMGFSEARGG